MKSTTQQIRKVQARQAKASNSTARNTPTYHCDCENTVPAKESVKSTVARVLSKIK